MKNQKLGENLFCAFEDCTSLAILGDYCNIHYKEYERRAESAEARAAQLEAEQEQILEASSTLSEMLTDMWKERDELSSEVERLTRFLQTIVNLGDKDKHAAFDGERHREMRHCANQALNTKNEEYTP